MAGVVHKNPFGLLDDDGDSSPGAAVKGADKSSRGKPDAGRGGTRGRGVSGNEAAFRDRNAGHDRNRSKPTDEGPRGGARGGYGARVRGGRGARHRSDRDDRHTKGHPGGGSEKQAAAGWGATEGEAELKDEQAGEHIAKTEQKEEGEAAKEEEPAEPEEKQVSYSDYLAQQAEKKLALDSQLEARKPNEGSKLDKKWVNAKPLVKDDDEDFISGTYGKAKRERERKTKQVVEIDQRYVEPERTRAGRGGRGGRGPRGDARGAPRGGPSRGRGREGAQLNTNDQQAFPSLGK